MMDIDEARPLFEKNIAAFQAKHGRPPNVYERSFLIPDWASESASMTLMVSAMTQGP